jgi:hypothetical protein
MNAYRKQHVLHILLDCFDIRHNVHRFTDAHTLSRENRLINSEAARRHGQKPAVGRNLVTNRHDNDIARNDLRRRYAVDFSGTEYISFVRGVLHQGLMAPRVSTAAVVLGTRDTTHINGLFRVALLNNTDSGVCDEDEQDYSRLYKGTKRRGILLGFEQGQDEGYDGRAKKDQDELVLELLEEELPKRRSWLFGELFRWESLSVEGVEAGMA